MSVSGIFKEAAEQGALNAVGSDAAGLGYTIKYLESIMPSQKTIEKVASKTHIPEGMIKAAILKRAFSLSPLLTVAGLAAIPAIGIPALKGLGRRAGKATEGGSSSGSLGKGNMSSIGGIGPEEMKIYNRMIARQAMKNYQMRNLLDQIRMASGPVYGSPLFGQRTG